MLTRLYAAFIIPLIFVVFATPSHAVEPGVGFNVIKYELTLTPDPASKTVVGTETILFRSETHDLRQIVFSGNALIMDDVKLNGKSVHVSTDHGVLSFDLSDGLEQGSMASLRIIYHLNYA
jgi:aminopeptidase N